MKRKEFILRLSALAGVLPLAHACAPGKKDIPGDMQGASAHIGHLLRDLDFTAEPSVVHETGTVIIGAGISGLSAARTLMKNKHDDFILLDLEKEPGGNAASGANTISAYPWGAHYVPIPNNDLDEYLAFLEEADVITGYNAAGLPVYNEYHLCFEPEERLYINGLWQQGLIPSFGITAEEKGQTTLFLQKMDTFRQAKGNDGKDAFAIPVNRSSEDEQYLLLDQLSFAEWLTREGFTAPSLLWYCNYCCRDDFGSDIHTTSAWAGIHYFAARKGVGANAQHQDVLTWPEGNGFLVNQLFSGIGNRFKSGKLAVGITMQEQGVTVLVVNAQTRTTEAYSCKRCIAATPQFITSRMLGNEDRSKLMHEHFSYTPWLVANITTPPPEERSGESMSWDNVIYGSKSLGYVNACHQHITMPSSTSRRVLTWYMPFAEDDPAAVRRHLQQMPVADLKQLVLSDLSSVHPNLAQVAERIDTMVWGHGMIRPVPGFIHSGIRQKLATPLGQKLFFAHTDLAGISIFEEAFYQGLEAANALIRSL